MDESALALVGGSEDGVIPAILNNDPVGPAAEVEDASRPTTKGFAGNPKLKAGVEKAAPEVDGPPTFLPKENELNGFAVPEVPASVAPVAC